MQRKILVSSLLFVGFLSAAHATTPTLNQLSPDQANSVMQNFGAALAFRPVETPSSYGKIFGLSFGVIGGVTSAAKVNDVLAQKNTGQHLPAIPMADIFGGVQLPYGIGIEVMGTPKVKISSVSASRIAAAVRWTFTDQLVNERVPFDAALRVGIGHTSMSYDQVVSNVADTVDFGSTVTMAELAFSRSFYIVEPYLGLGYAHMSNTLSNTGSSTLYNFTSSDSYSHGQGSFLFNFGVQLKLTVLAVTGEFDNVFGESTGLLKVSFKF